jgi:hypothetical protein
MTSRPAAIPVRADHCSCGVLRLVLVYVCSPDIVRYPLRQASDYTTGYLTIITLQFQITGHSQALHHHEQPDI